MSRDFSKIKSSFRDPSGFVFIKDNEIYRQINYSYKDNYDHLINSGLYEKLVEEGLFIPHEEVQINFKNAYKIIKPKKIDFVSYPYEWCFSELKDAALITLKIQKISLQYDMCLKDASSYNIQFSEGRPLLIDSLSFERYKEESPWIAYKQFCQHFLAPLALMSFKDVRLNQLMKNYIDGIPLDLASKLLPFSTYMRFSFLTHIHLHAKAQMKFGLKKLDINKCKIKKKNLIALIEELEQTIENIKWNPKGTEWVDYYKDTNYSASALEYKTNIIDEYLNLTKPKSVWDFGANVGMFSRIASKKGIRTISFDIDYAAVEKNYLNCKASGEKYILPLLLDLTNPSPAIGWANEERLSLVNRGPVDMIFALALIHHLVISNNIPFEYISEFFSRICKYLIIEFVPKTDSQTQRLLQSKKDIFYDYTEERFESSFSNQFRILKKTQIKDSLRTLYLMENYSNGAKSESYF